MDGDLITIAIIGALFGALLAMFILKAIDRRRNRHNVVIANRLMAKLVDNRYELALLKIALENAQCDRTSHSYHLAASSFAHARHSFSLADKISEQHLLDFEDHFSDFEEHIIACKAYIKESFEHLRQAFVQR